MGPRTSRRRRASAESAESASGTGASAPLASTKPLSPGTRMPRLTQSPTSWTANIGLPPVRATTLAASSPCSPSNRRTRVPWARWSSGPSARLSRPSTGVVAVASTSSGRRVVSSPLGDPGDQARPSDSGPSDHADAPRSIEITQGRPQAVPLLVATHHRHAAQPVEAQPRAHDPERRSGPAGSTPVLRRGRTLPQGGLGQLRGGSLLQALEVPGEHAVAAAEGQGLGELARVDVQGVLDRLGQMEQRPGGVSRATEAHRRRLLEQRVEPLLETLDQAFQGRRPEAGVSLAVVLDEGRSPAEQLVSHTAQGVEVRPGPELAPVVGELLGGPCRRGCRRGPGPLSRPARRARSPRAPRGAP